MLLKKKHLGIIFLLLILGVVGYLYQAVNEPPNEVSVETATDVRIKSEELLDSFVSDRDLANKIYVEKTIEVEGVVKEITFFNNRYTVILQGGGEYMCIMCDMKENQYEQIKTLSVGHSVVLKGICKGFLMDAILLNCVLVNQTNE